MFNGRKSEIAWLERMSLLGPTVVISGLRGVGKSALAQHWCQQKGSLFQWFMAHKFHSLEEECETILGVDSLSSLDKALVALKKSWNDNDIIIWDEFHFLKDKDKNALISFIERYWQDKKHIILSDEEVKLSPLSPIPQLKLAPLSQEELKEWIEVLPRELIKEEISFEEVYKKTSGLPLLVHIWLHTQDFDSSYATLVLEDLGENEKELLWALSLLSRPIEKAEIVGLLDVYKVSSSFLETFQKKLLLQKTATGYFSVADFLIIYAKNELGEKRHFIEKKLTSFLLAQKRKDKVEILTHALSTHSISFVLEVFGENGLLKITPEDLDHYSTKVLSELSEIFSEIPQENINNETLLASVCRLRLRTLFLLGKRQEAKEISSLVIEHLSDTSKKEESVQRLSLEYIQLLNRMGLAQAAIEMISKIYGHTSSPVKEFLDIEKNVAYISSVQKDEIIKAKENLKALITKLSLNYIQEHEWDLALAHGYFQLARAYYHLYEFQEAGENFSKAQSIFSKLNLTYFDLVCQLNLGWVYFKLSNWGPFDEITEKASHTAHTYGYTFLLSGLELLAAKKNRYFLRPKSAYENIERSLKLLGEAPPSSVLHDILIEKCRVAIALGRMDLVEETFLKIQDQISKHPQLKRSKNFELLCCELDSLKDNIEKSLDHWEKIERNPYDEPVYEFYRLVHGLKVEGKLGDLPLIKLAKKSYDLIHALKKNDEDEAWEKLASLESLIKESEGLEGEKIALALIEASLVKDGKRKKEFLQVAQKFLLNWQASDEFKDPLAAWFDSLKGNTSLEEHPLWKKSLSGIKAKWGPMRPASSHSSEKFRLISKKGEKSTNKFDHYRNRKALTVIEHLNEVWFEGVSIEKITGRHQLRKILVVMMQSYPKAVRKEKLASVVWGESYSPQIHDSRIYTSIKRLRELLGDESYIVNTEEGYFLKKSLNFYLVQPKKALGSGNHRLETLIMEALESFSKRGQGFVSRSILVDATSASEASVKRALSSLLSKSWITRQGQGRSVRYTKREY
jgi:DNA-binding winged helix-turn-helix (wHTH) protein/tetratricopeptide (TPR) repeat protein